MKQIGYFSLGKNEINYVFHYGTDREPEEIERALNANLGGGPYKVFAAFIEEIENESNN